MEDLMAVVPRESFSARLERTISLPVLMKEMRSRMRGIRAPVLLFFATGITITIGLLILALQWDEGGTSISEMSRHLADMGRSLFVGLMIVEGVLCALISPALTAGAISIEREQQTFELLLLTRLTSANLVLGKLISSLSFVLVVLICAMPVAAISFLLGGVDPAQFCWSLAIIVAVVVSFGAFGLFCSARFAKTTTAVVVSYTLCIGWLVLMPLAVALLGSVSSSDSEAWVRFLVITLVVFVLALVPATAASVLLTFLFRTRMPRAVNLALWGTACVVLGILLNLPGVVSSSDLEVLLIGNPIVAMIAIITDDHTMLFSGSSLPGGVVTVLQHLLLPICIGIQLIAAWVAIVLAVGEVQKLRR
jgi:ABC-type transport system involved in multi-copper enzyme maturation permease subunit